MDPDVRGGGTELEGEERGQIINRTYCLKTTFDKKKNIKIWYNLFVL